MKVINGGRASGKTYQAIKYASENWLYILVRNRQEATEIFQMANELDFSIPYPVTVDELMRGNVKGTSLERDGIIVDNALSVQVNNGTQSDKDEIARLEAELIKANETMAAVNAQSNADMEEARTYK